MEVGQISLYFSFTAAHAGTLWFMLIYYASSLNLIKVMVLAHFCITKKAKTKPKQKKISTTKKNTPQKGKEFAYSLCRLQKNKRKAKFNLRKSCFRYGFIRWISPHTYILYIYILYIFRCTKGCFWGQTRRAEKSGEIYLATLVECLKVAWFITPELSCLPRTSEHPSAICTQDK